MAPILGAVNGAILSRTKEKYRFVTAVLGQGQVPKTTRRKSLGIFDRFSNGCDGLLKI